MTLSCVFQTPRPPRPRKVVARRISTHQKRKMTYDWSVTVFSQALKWARENQVEPDEMILLRRMHQRCVVERNNARYLKRERN